MYFFKHSSFQSAPRTVRILWSLSVLLLLTGTTGRAQDYVISLRHWDMTDGLIHRQVNCGLKDKQGYLWFGTAEGLSRFDGYSFKNYNTDNAGMPFTNIECIAQDGNGMIWLAASSGVNNVCLLSPLTGKISRPEKYFDRKILLLQTLSDGRILLESEGAVNEWHVYSPDSGFCQLPIPQQANYTYHATTAHNTLWFSHGAHDMLETDLNGRVLSEWRLAGVPDINNADLLPPGLASFTRQVSAKTLYQLTTDHQAHALPYAPAANPMKLSHVISTGLDDIIWRQGRLYHPTRGKIKDFTTEGWEDLEGSVRMGLPVAPGDLWIGGSFGLYHVTIRKSLFTKYFYDASGRQVPENGYRGLLRVGNRLLGAHDKWGIMSEDIYNKDSSIIFSSSSNNSSRFTDLQRLQDSILLFVSHGQLYRADKHAGKITVTGNTGPVPVWCAYEWGPDSLLLGTEQGLEWFSRNTKRLLPFTGYNADSALRETTVNDIIAQRDGTLCICAGNGLYFLDKQKGITARYSATGRGSSYLPASRFMECLEEGNGRYWLSTGSGLLYWDRKKNSCRRFTSKDGLSNNVIYAACPDKNGRLWLPSDYGLMCFNKATAQVTTYLTEDGISSNEFNRISQFQDADGTLYFGSINGVTAFNPADFAPGGSKGGARVPAPLVITAFQQFDGSKNILADKTQQLLQTHRITLAPGDRFFSIELALLNYTDPSHTTYYWMIEGIDKRWNEQNARTIRLSALPFGSYRLRLMARAANGVSSGNELLLLVNVPAPFYRTWPFLLLLCMLVLCTIAFFIVSRNRRIRKENHRLEEVVNTRTKTLTETIGQKDLLLKEIHHRVKNNLQIITSLQRLQSAYSTDATVKAAMEESQNRILSIAFIHQNLYMQEDMQGGVEMDLFVSELAQHIANVFYNPAITIAVQVAVPGVKLDIDTAVPLGLIINELITNSYKYAFASRSTGTIRIAISDNGDGSYELLYTDDGTGLPAGFTFADATGMGMRLVFQLSEQLGGEMEYTFRQGSRFMLKFWNYEQRSNN